MRSPLSASPRLVLYIFIFVLCPAITANAQFRAVMQGSVTDAHGAAVVGATLTLINNETNRTQQSTSSDEGFYRFDRLPPGKYMLVVEHAGFKKAVSGNVDVKAEEAQGINIQLEVGEITDTVTVSSELAEQLNTENANIARAITKQEVLRLPQYGRDPYELVRLAPGVFGLGARICCGLSLTLPNSSVFIGSSSQSVFASQNQPPISANGQRVMANSFEVDGVSVNSQVYGGSATLTPNQESVKEVRVASSSYSAENGGNSGALIQVVSQNGTNEFHGSAFFKDNDPTLNAFNKWGGPDGNLSRRDPKRYSAWGGSFGGPLFLPRFGEDGRYFWSGKNKLFFFFSYETIRIRRNNSANYWTETPEYRQLLRQQRPGSIAARIVSAQGMEPRVQSIIARNCASVGLNDPTKCATLPGGLDIGSPTGLIGQEVTNAIGGGLDGIPDIRFAQVLFPNYNKAQQFNGRIDYQVKSSDLVALSLYDTPVADFSAQDFRPSYDINSVQRSITGALLWSHTFSPTTLNEARFNVTRFSRDGIKDNPDTLWGIPHIQVNKFPFCCVTLNFGPYAQFVSYQTSYNFRDVLSKVMGSHGLKFGGSVAYDQNDDYRFGVSRPEYNLGSLWSFANDAPIAEFGNFDPRTGVPTGLPNYIRANNYSFFVQDDWKAWPNLSLNLGLRWEYFGPFRDKSDNLGILILGSGQNALTDARFKIGGSLYEPDRNNFGPQLGFAWSPQRIIGYDTKDKLVLRGGFGIGYNRIPQRLIADGRMNPPFWTGLSVLTGSQIVYSLGPTLTSYSGWPSNPNTIQQFDPTTNIPLTGPRARTFATLQHVPNPYTYRYSLDVQYDLGSDWVATLGYQGSASHKLPRNDFLSVPRNPHLSVRMLLTDVSTNFNALLASLTHRFSDGFNFNAQYRWSKSIDSCSDEFCSLPPERAPSDYDVTHYFVASGLWDLPILRNRQDFVGNLFGGWQLNGILTASSGFPWTPIYEDFTRPVAYLGGLKQDTSNGAFIKPGGTFGTDASKFFVPAPEDAVTIPPPGIGRNVFRGPRYFTVDMSLIKRFSIPKFARLGDAAKFDLRANFFNVFNSLNLAPFQFGDSSTIIDSPDFGRASQPLSGRVVEFQARLSF
jgi:hypothetical protein